MLEGDQITMIEGLEASSDASDFSHLRCLCLSVVDIARRARSCPPRKACRRRGLAAGGSRKVLEAVANDDIDQEPATGLFNRRGVTTRMPTDGGG